MLVVGLTLVLLLGEIAAPPETIDQARQYMAELDDRVCTLQSTKWHSGRCIGNDYEVWFDGNDVVVADWSSSSRFASSHRRFCYKDGEPFSAMFRVERHVVFDGEQPLSHADVFFAQRQVQWLAGSGHMNDPRDMNMIDALAEEARWLQVRALEER